MLVSRRILAKFQCILMYQLDYQIRDFIIPPKIDGTLMLFLTKRR